MFQRARQKSKTVASEMLQARSYQDRDGNADRDALPIDATVNNIHNNSHTVHIYF